jgi:hypothetical protein
MSFNVPSHASAPERRTPVLGVSAETARTERGSPSERKPLADASVTLEAHWQASIESATD